VCNPLGKSGGSAIQQLMIIGFGSLAASTPYLGVILLIVVLAWLAAASSLNKQARAGRPSRADPLLLTLCDCAGSSVHVPCWCLLSLRMPAPLRGVPCHYSTRSMEVG